MTAQRTLLVAIDGRERPLLLRIGEVFELERLCGAGVGEIAQRLGFGTYGMRLVRETIRLALAGGGSCTLAEAGDIVAYFVDRAVERQEGISGPLAVASRVIDALIAGLPEGPPPGEAPAEPSSNPATPPRSTRSARK